LPKYAVSDAARSDVRGIIRYTTVQWNGEQAARYAAGLQACFRMLSQSPGMGRGCDSVSIGLRRFEHGKHVVFYRIVAGGILIVRVLHQRMLPDKSRFEA
jgi:toxin ParE1/3/4